VAEKIDQLDDLKDLENIIGSGKRMQREATDNMEEEAF
jgi:hypothetical protein